MKRGEMMMLPIGVIPMFIISPRLGISDSHGVTGVTEPALHPGEATQ